MTLIKPLPLHCTLQMLRGIINQGRHIEKAEVILAIDDDLVDEEDSAWLKESEVKDV